MRYTKKCESCKQDLPFSRFAESAMSSDGLRSKCKHCVDIYRKPPPKQKRVEIAETKDQLAIHPAQKVSLNAAQKRYAMKAPGTKYVRPENAVPPPTFTRIKEEGSYSTPQSYYRNDGNAHIKSRGL